jgi:SAM-dependent methyltransferase
MVCKPEFSQGEKWYKNNFRFIFDITGKNYTSAEEIASKSNPSPTALVPLCGASPVVGLLADGGWSVHAVDASETALRRLVQITEESLPLQKFPKAHLHYGDVFSAEVWRSMGPDAKFDFIYDRMGMACIAREKRQDYAFLMRQALKPGGIMFVEGVFRTGRVKGNKVSGPPFGLSLAELQDLFPEKLGLLVKCRDQMDPTTSLDRESRVLKRVPREMYVTTFPCIVLQKSDHPN